MKTPELPIDECDRLKDLFEYEILDTSPERNLDEVTSLASFICETPIALISLVDEHRQWFKSRVGLDAASTPRNISFCGHALHSKDIFEVGNTLTDDRFKDNPLVVAAPHIRFYAGAPLISQNGHVLGTLCVIDKIPRRLTEHQKNGLRTLARHVVDLFELRQSNKNITALNENLTEANRRVTQQQDAFVQSAKLQTMGAVASGICYELGHPLTSIQARLKIMSDALNSDKFDKNLLGESITALDNNIQRIDRMVKTLRQFTKDDDLVLKQINIHELVRDLMTLMREQFANGGIKLLFDLPEEAEFRGSYNQVSQVIINLLHNAYDAVLNKSNSWVKISVTTDAEYVNFHITDSGMALTPEIKSQLFRPFFTTKPIGQGVGLSLYNSRGIVENHRGELFLDESWPQTTFTAKFPR